MPNTLTNLIPVIYEAMDMVARELVGMVPSVALSASAERAGKDQTIRAHVAPASSASDVTPGVTPPNDGDQTFGTVDLVINKSRRVPFRWNGEESKSINAPGGIGRARMQLDQVAQAFRTLANEIENDLTALHINASRANGTAGTTPFAFNGTSLSGFEDIAGNRKILVDNGAPLSDLQCVIDTAAGAKMRSIAQLNRADATGGGDAFRTQGILLPLHGMDVRESGQIKTFTKGTGAAYTTNTAGYAIGATSITLITGTGTVLAGDVVTFAGDTNKYVVATGVAAPGAIVLAAPGLRQAIPTSATALTILNNSARSMAFHRNAIMLATRIPALPEEGDMATDRMVVTDPRSGLSFEIAIYKQYRQVQYEVSCAWGMKVVKPEFLSLLLG